uniref:PDZ domain-containing protein n=1 Tax=Dermatophagoides pteronyssinus TaxID=6956 RepID=A0A6P6YGG6_DERPT|nr:putative uncharacterized protein DDB_G0282133 [Dermatophagoides pteronyssinus]
MNGPSETATLPPPTTPIQSNGGLFSSYYHPHQHQLHHHNQGNHYPLNGHYHLYPSTTNGVNQTNGSQNGESLPSLNDGDIHVTVLQIDQQQLQQSTYPYCGNSYHNGHEVINSLSSKNSSFNQHHNNQQLTGLNSDFVTVLTIISTGATIMTPSSSTITTTTANQTTMNGTGSLSNYNHQNSNQRIFVDNKRGEIEEEVIIYRLPGERLGMALRFDGGQSATETIRRVFVQSITLNSPSAKAIGLMLGMLREGDEILQIDGRSSSSLTRLECITLLRDAPVCIRLFVRRRNCPNSLNDSKDNESVPMTQNCQKCPSQQHPTSMTTTTMTTMTTVAVPKVSNCCQMPIHLPNNSLHLNSNHNHLNNNNDSQNRLTKSSVSLSSSTSSLISAANTPLLNQLLNSCSDQSIANNKKVPPPVPPRMATTTLSSKRKPRPMPIPPTLTVDNPNEIVADQHHRIDSNVNSLTNQSCNQSSEQTIIIKQNSGSGDIEHRQYSTPIVHQQNQQSTTNQSAVVEKPPRRKNVSQNGTGHQNVNGHANPPPLPPRRPKGPPPKPPIDRIQSTPSIVNVNLIQNQNNNNISNGVSQPTTPVVTTAKSLPSLVTVIHSPTNSNLGKVKDFDPDCDKSITESSQQQKSNDSLMTPKSCHSAINSAAASTLLIKTGHLNTENVHEHPTTSKSTSNNTAKVTFNISNSKVSSFIRQTAEKLHRKLSGKTISSSSSSSLSNGDSDEEKNVIMNSINDGQSRNSNDTTTVIVDLAKTTIDNKEKIQGMKLDNVILVNSNNNKSTVEYEAEEKPTTLSSASLSSTTLTTTPPPTAASYSDFNQYAEESFESDTDDTSSSVSTIIERGPYHGNDMVVEQENAANVDDYEIANLSIVDRVLSPFEKLDNKEFPVHKSPVITAATDSSEMNLLAQPLVTNLAIVTDKHHSQQQHHQLSSDKTDNVLINDNEQLMMMMNTMKANMMTKNGAIANEPMLIDADRLFPIDASPNSIGNDTDDFRRDHPQANGGVDVDRKQSDDLSIIKQNDHSDDEDLNEIKNDLFSRLDDDKDDFMIDTDYLNESSSRFMFHHNSSELILNSYSELSSITEEDEDDDNSTFEAKFNDNIDTNRAVLEKQKQQKPVVPEKPIIGNIQPVNMNNDLAKINELNPMLIANDECQDNKNKEQMENLKDEFNDNEMNRSHTSDCGSSTSSTSSSSDQTKVSLDNVFEFLNKAADDFEFVERMLELTNDKIDSIDDIMRIRESLRGLQESDQRENLQRFLDGKDVFEELIALSSPSSTSSVSSSSMFSSSLSSTSSHSSTPSSPDHEFPPSEHHIHDKLIANIKRSDGRTPTHNLTQTESSMDFASLPVCLSDQQPPLSSVNTQKLLLNPPPASKQQCKQPTPVMMNKSIIMTNKVDQPIDSKIPTLFPITMSKPSLNNLNKRSQSISNIFTRSNSTMSSGSFTSLIETKPSLIPRPISNFNLSLPQSTLNNNNSNLKNVSQQRTINRTTSHNCLNRSTSMQSIFSTNSLSRSTKPTSRMNGTLTTPRRQSNITSGSSLSSSTTSTGKNYHHNCLNHNDGSPYGYGSLSRSVSKSSTNVYNTGSLPRPTNKQTSFHNLTNNNNNNRHNQSNVQSINQDESSNTRDFRTTSLTDLTYGSITQPTLITTKELITLKNKHQLQSQNGFKSFNHNYHQNQFNPNRLPTSTVNNHKQYLISNENLFRSDSLNSTNNGNPFLLNDYHHLHHHLRHDNLEKDHNHYNTLESHSLANGDDSSINGFSSFEHSKNLIWLNPNQTQIQQQQQKSPNSSNFWHYHNNQNSSKLRTSLNNNKNNTVITTNNNIGNHPLSLSKVKPTTNSLQLQISSNNNNNNNLKQTSKNLIRNCKIDQTIKSTSCSLSNKSSDNEEVVPLQQPRSILRNSCKSNKYNNNNSNSIVQTIEENRIERKVITKEKTTATANIKTRPNFGESSCSSSSSSSSSTSSSQLSDSESSDIVTTCSDSSDFQLIHHHNNNSQNLDWTLETKRPHHQQHRVCFMDQIEQHPSKHKEQKQQLTINGDLPIVQTRTKQDHHHHNQQQQQKLTDKMNSSSGEHHLYSSSPEEVAILSSSTSTSSISSLGSLTDNFNHKKLSFKTAGKSVSFENDDQHQSDNLQKSPFFLTPNPHREDSGIFASDDTSSTSEFSHSPSPELLARPAIEKISQVTTENQQQQCTNQNKQMAVNNNGNQLLSLSRSSSAPCETEVIAPMKTILSEKQANSSSGENSLLSRDSFITVRRHQNVCKLKGLIIPDTINDGQNECDSISTVDDRIEIDLPTIISEEILKIEDLNKNNSLKVNQINQQTSKNNQPIEIIPLKPANVTVPKYSPMFKRRVFSLPVNDYLNGEKLEQNINSETVKGPNIPPKPRLSKTMKPVRMNCPPPFPPKPKESDQDLIVKNDSEHENKNNVRDEPKQKIMNEFVIYQKQHSMRAIIFQLNDLNLNDEKEYLSHLGFTIKGGFDSDSDNVTVESIDPNGMAAQDGRLQKGDRIISINGKRLAGMTHNKIIDLLKSSCLSEKVVLVFTRPHETNKNEMNDDYLLSLGSIPTDNKESPKLASTISIESDTDANNNNFKIIKADITKDVTGLGFMIEGGKDSSFGDKPISIKRIYRGGPIDKEGTLLEGDELLFVNNHPMEEMTRSEAWNFLKKLPDGIVSMVVRRRTFL